MVEWGNHEKCKLLIFLFVSILMSTAMVSVANAQFGSWNLPENYTLVVKMIDVEGYKAWLQLFNGTTLVKEAIVSSSPWDPPESRVFIYRKTMYGEADQPFFVCYLDGVMRGINANVVKLKYGWMISDNNITIFNLGDHLGVFEVYVAWGNQLVLQNPSNVTLARNSVVDLIENMKFRVNDSSDLRYHPFIWNGTAEISGQEFIETNGSWNATNFPAFWYDPKLRIYTEKLSIDHLVNAANRNISERNLTYQTYATQMNYMVYKYTGARVDGQANYSAAGWLGEKYVAIKGNVAKLSKLLLEMKERDYKLISSSNPTMWTKQLYEGYNLSIKDISVDSDKVWIQLTKDGIVVDDQILTEGALYVYRNATDSEVINATVDTIFRGTQTNLVKLVNVKQYSEANGSLLYSGTLIFSGDPPGLPWVLNEGYTLIVKDIDLDGNKVWLRLTNASGVVDDRIIDTRKQPQDRVYIYSKPLSGYSNVPILVVYVDNIYRGTDASTVTFKYAWQISENVTEIHVGDPVGNLTVALANPDGIVAWNANPINLSQGSTIYLYEQALGFQVIDSNYLAYYPFVRIPVNGTIEIRGQAFNESAGTWNATNFPAFWNISYLYYSKPWSPWEDTETLSILQPDLSGTWRTISKGNLVYTTTRTPMLYKVYSEVNWSGQRALDTDLDFNYGTYYFTGWLGERYVLVKGDCTKLSKLVLEQGKDDFKNLSTGGVWDLGEGYSLKVNATDVVGNRVWLQLLKDGNVVKESIVGGVSPTDPDEMTFKYKKTLAGMSDAPFFVCFVDRIFREGGIDYVTIKYAWMISDNVIEINVDDTFGVFKVRSVNESTIMMDNDRSITLIRNSTIDLFGGIKFKVADSSYLRYYPFIQATVNGTVQLRGQAFNETAGIWNATNFDAFYFDLQRWLYTESILISQQINGTNRVINPGNFRYQTYDVPQPYMVYSKTGATVNGQQNYYVIGFKARKNVAIYGNATKLTQLLYEMGPNDYKILSLTFAPTYNITGYVTNASSGAPISGATVSINTSLPTTITNAAGYYNFSGVPNGTYLVTASATGYNSNSITVSVSGGDITNANISLSPIQPVNKAEFYVDKLHVLATSGDSLPDRSYTVGTNFIAGVFNWDDDSNQDIPPPINITMTALDARYFYGPYLLSNNTTTGYWQYPYTLKETQGRGIAFIRVIPDETINFDFDIARKIDSVVYSNGYKTANFSVTYYNLGGDRYTRCGIMTKNTSVANVTLLPSTLNTDIPTDSIVNWTSEDELTSIILLNVNKTQVVLNRPYNISVQYYIELKGAPIIYKPRFLVAIRAPISAPSYSNEGNSITLDSSYLSPYPVQFAMANTTTSISWYKSKTLDVEKELYQVSVLLDSDGDGIIDTLDPFPNEAEARGPVWNVGDYWNFTFINATLTSYVNRTVAQIATIDGQEFYIANTTHPAGFYQVYFTSHGFNLYKLDIVDPNVLDSTYIPSWDIYNLPLFVGKTWKYNYTRFDSNATINRLQLLTFNGTVVGREIISSPAGAFECYIVEVKTHNATTGNLVQHAKYWYPVGELPKYLVKLENYDITTGLIDNTWVLNDASALPPVIANETQSVPEIPANNATPFAFNNTTVVVNLNITTNITVKNVTIIVQELNASALDPGTFSVNISGTVYSYFNILSTLNESEIKSVDITFNVSKQWLDSNGLDPAKVALYRYHNGSWENYTAREIARDGNITYIATVPAFSIFGIATQVKAITWTPPPSEGGGGGGGGGGAAPGEPYENIADTEVRYIWTIAPNKQNTVEFKKSTHHILEISFAYSQVADEVSVIIEKLINSSLLANGTPPGVVFENTNIWVNVPNPSYVSNASVKFSVEKSWISANSIDSNSIALYRFKDGAWNKLSTAKLFENDTLIFYIASTPGFSSPFAIAGEKISAVPTTPTPTPTPMATPTPPTGTAEISPTPTKPAPGFDLTVAAIGAITAIYLWRRRF
jgi:S-layer protein (TIGR01567 family)